MAILTSLWQFLTSPRLPQVALAFIDNEAVLLNIKKRRGNFYVEHIATAFLPKALLRPDFSASNISEVNSLVDLIRQASSRAKLSRQSRWSIALPEEVARTMVVKLDTKPQNQEELEKMLAWKVERIVGLPMSQLRLVHQQIPNISMTYLVTVVAETVMAEYEKVFSQLGWQTGLIMPRHIGEATWLMKSNLAGDKLLVSHNNWGFTAFVLREGSPVMIRSRECAREDLESELFRLATYYQEKIMLPENNNLNLLIIGDNEKVELTSKTFADALNQINLKVLQPSEFAINIPDNNYQFNQIAAAAGLATLAYN
ncbi:MAG: hypothetical protein IPK14_07995 [Blastocatellia bacterium]|nr:hypothetical protein [Blastocatellia bacterium]